MRRSSRGRKSGFVLQMGHAHTDCRIAMILGGKLLSGSSSHSIICMRVSLPRALSCSRIMVGDVTLFYEMFNRTRCAKVTATSCDNRPQVGRMFCNCRVNPVFVAPLSLGQGSSVLRTCPSGTMMPNQFPRCPSPPSAPLPNPARHVSGNRIQPEGPGAAHFR